MTVVKPPPKETIISEVVVIRYEIYKDSRDASWKFLLKHKIRKLPVDLKKLTSEMKIAVKNDVSGVLEPSERGKVIRDRKHTTIIIRPSDTCQNRFTIMHEIGHIVFGHTEKSYVKTDDDEYTAERFAIDVLAPACVLWGLDIHSAEDIQQLCQISFTSAKRRAERMETLYRRNMFLSHPLERKVFAQFSGFISKYKTSEFF